MKPAKCWRGSRSTAAPETHVTHAVPTAGSCHRAHLTVQSPIASDTQGVLQGEDAVHVHSVGCSGLGRQRARAEAHRRHDGTASEDSLPGEHGSLQHIRARDVIITTCRMQRHAPASIAKHPHICTLAQCLAGECLTDCKGCRLACSHGHDMWRSDVHTAPTRLTAQHQALEYAPSACIDTSIESMLLRGSRSAARISLFRIPC